ncbi:S26 family signal peptidase [Halorubrum gandharaense]
MNRRLAVDVAVPLLAVCLLVGVAFGLSGVWPPLVAVESDSMAPGVERGDLVVVTDTERYPAGGLVGSYDSAAESAPERLGGPGDVIVFSPPDSDDPPILHRVAFAVEAGEDWTVRADDERLSGDCGDLRHCPAPHGGYVTYGDANGEYDQSAGIAPVVADDWVHAKAQFHVPSLGWARIAVDAVVARIGTAGVLVAGLGLGAVVGGGFAVFAGRVADRRRR